MPTAARTSSRARTICGILLTDERLEPEGGSLEDVRGLKGVFVVLWVGMGERRSRWSGRNSPVSKFQSKGSLLFVPRSPPSILPNILSFPLSTLFRL